MTTTSRASLLPICALAAAGLWTCGGDAGSRAAAAGAGAAPTADEVRAAQAGGQAGSDGSEAGSAASQSGTARADITATVSGQASASTPLLTRRARCFVHALKAGAALDLAAQTSLRGSIAPNISGVLKGSAAASLGRRAPGSDRAIAAENVGVIALMFDAADCDLGPVTLSGNELISIDDGDSAHPSAQVVTDLTFSHSDATVRVTSTDSNKATYQVDATGAASDAAAASRTFDVFINEHRVRTLAATAKVDLDVATQTVDDDGVAVVETYAEVSASDAGSAAAYSSVQTRTLTSGTVRTTHRLAKFTADTTFTQLKHDLSGTCSCPVSGTLTQQVSADDKSRSAVHTYTFTGCGEAKVESQVTTAAGAVRGESTVRFENCG